MMVTMSINPLAAQAMQGVATYVYGSLQVQIRELWTGPSKPDGALICHLRMQCHELTEFHSKRHESASFTCSAPARLSECSGVLLAASRSLSWLEGAASDPYSALSFLRQPSCATIDHRCTRSVSLPPFF